MVEAQELVHRHHRNVFLGKRKVSPHIIAKRCLISSLEKGYKRICSHQNEHRQMRVLIGLYRMSKEREGFPCTCAAFHFATLLAAMDDLRLVVFLVEGNGRECLHRFRE